MYIKSLIYVRYSTEPAFSWSSIRLTTYLLLFFVLVSCTPPKELPADQYERWISREENGLVKTKTVQNVTLTVRYLPAQWLAYREWKTSETPSVYDSVLHAYKCGIVFQLTLQADKQDKKYGSLMYFNASSREEVMQRIEELNFGIESMLFMEHNSEIYTPVLSHFEGFDQIGNRATFLVSFIIPEFNCGEPKKELSDFKLVFEDPVWRLGTNNFEFSSEQLTTVPRLMI